MSYGASGSVVLGPDVGGIPQSPMQLPTTLFRFGEQTVWSSQFCDGGAVPPAVSTLFSTPQNQVGQGFLRPLDLPLTNQRESGRVPTGQSLEVYGIALQLLHASANTDAPGTTLATPADTDGLIGDVLNILNNVALSWNFIVTTIDIAPAMLVGQGGGAFGAVSTTQNATDRGHMNNGAGNIFVYRKHPILLPGSSTFNIRAVAGLRAAVLSSGLVMRSVLCGYYKTAIELG